MIRFKFSGMGNRNENLDVISSFKYKGCNVGIALLDGYDCSEDDINQVSKVISEFDFSHGAVEGLIKICKGLPVKVSACFVFKLNNNIHIYSAGDCRVYNREGHLLTVDDSVAWKELKDKGISEKKIPHLVGYCPNRNYLTSFIDFCSDTINLTHSVFDLNPSNQELMMCTDGFWEHFDEDTAQGIFIGNVEANLTSLKDSFPDYVENHTVCLVCFEP